jgi:hypothetical protein
MDGYPSCLMFLHDRVRTSRQNPRFSRAFPRFLEFVFDDYAENIQQKKDKTSVFARFSRFFWPQIAFFPGFPGKTPI